MKKIVLEITVVLAIVFMPFIFALTFASDSDKDTVTVQGVIMELDLNTRMMVVNERYFAFDQNTFLHNEKGSPVTQDRLKIKTWVYIEGTPDKAHQRVVARKTYLLPKYIDKKEQHLYPFIK